MSLVIVPYLLNIKQLPEDQVYEITEKWLIQCKEQSPLKFDYALIWNKIDNARDGKYKPMGLMKLFERMLEKSPETHLLLQNKFFPPTRIDSYNKGLCSF